MKNLKDTDLYAQAREWLLDMMTDPDDEPAIDRILSLDDEAVQKRIGKKYRGGWKKFVAEHAV